MKNLMKYAACAAALVMVSGCAYFGAIGADRNADGTYRPNAELPDGDGDNSVDALKPQEPGNQGPSYSRTESVRSEDSDELLGGPDR